MNVGGDHEARGASFATLMRARRLQLGLTLAEVAERAGCAKSYLSQVENGQKGPPAPELVGRLESALSLDTGELARAADWAHTPGPVKLDFARYASREREVRRLIESVERDGLDGAFASGELARLVERLAPEPGIDAGRLADLLPAEVPLINSVAAGYPAAFTDLGYPARVADEYVRCPDLADPDAFAARVVGDSMEPDYREGDIVVFSPLAPIASGDACFVRLEPDHESTFKRVYFETRDAGDELIRIQPINGRYPPRTVSREEVAGLYRAVHLMRSVG